MRFNEWWKSRWSWTALLLMLYVLASGVGLMGLGSLPQTPSPWSEDVNITERLAGLKAAPLPDIPGENELWGLRSAEPQRSDGSHGKAARAASAVSVSVKTSEDVQYICIDRTCYGLVVISRLDGKWQSCFQQAVKKGEPSPKLLKLSEGEVLAKMLQIKALRLHDVELETVSDRNSTYRLQTFQTEPERYKQKRKPFKERN